MSISIGEKNKIIFESIVMYLLLTYCKIAFITNLDKRVNTIHIYICIKFKL